MLAIVGIPDYFGCIRGHFIALELKDTGLRASKLQRYVLDKIRAAGGMAYEVTPENAEAIITILVRFARK